VGTVWIAVASADQLSARRHQFDGDRDAVRRATLVSALEALLEQLDND
jgi:nicotinamide-nucleotide amidase